MALAPKWAFIGAAVQLYQDLIHLPHRQAVKIFQRWEIISLIFCTAFSTPFPP